MPRPISPETEALVLGALEAEALSIREIARRTERHESLVLATLAQLVEAGRAVREMVPDHNSYRNGYRYGYRRAG